MQDLEDNIPPTHEVHNMMLYRLQLQIYNNFVQVCNCTKLQ